jgi:hypothetical protein
MNAQVRTAIQRATVRQNLPLSLGIFELREAFASHPKLRIDRRLKDGAIELWWLDDRDSSKGKLAEWPSGNEAVWVRGIACLFAELRRLRAAGQGGRWKDVVDG